VILKFESLQNNIFNKIIRFNEIIIFDQKIKNYSINSSLKFIINELKFLSYIHKI
jgi:hypothetical protein